VECVERLELDSPATRQLLAGYLGPLLAAGADNIVLGCTHYPFLRDSIQALVGDAVQIVDPAAAVAKEVMRKLPATDRKRELDVASAQAGQAGQVRFVTSDVLSHAQRVMQHLWAEPVQVESL
jgi:glutamate racemase